MKPITRETALFEYTDRAVRTYLKQIYKKFRRIEGALSFDELNVMSVINANWSDCYRLMVECFQTIARYYYRWGLITCGRKDEEDLEVNMWIVQMLNEYDELLHYMFSSEADRKRARLIEAVLSVEKIPDKKKQVEIALRYLVRQFEQFADNVTGRAVERAYEASDVEYVEWVTMRDEKVCSECRSYDGNVYRLDDCPSHPAHYNCRCFLIPRSFST